MEYGGTVIIPLLPWYFHLCPSRRPSPAASYQARSTDDSIVTDESIVRLTIKQLRNGWTGAVCPYCGTEFRVRNGT